MYNQDYHQILQFSNHGIVATDKDGLIAFVNKRAKEILRFKDRTLLFRCISKENGELCIGFRFSPTY